jgi:hypothetical protein
MKRLMVSGRAVWDSSAHYVALRSSCINKLTLTLTLFLISLQVVPAQTPDSSAIQPQQLFLTHKYQANNTTGWLFLVPGLSLMTVGTVGNMMHHNYVLKYGYQTQTGTKLFFFGSAMALTSIPFLLTTGKRKTKVFLSLKRGGVAIAERGPGNFHYPAIDLKIRF